jgi:hypothetical protein
MSDDDEGNALRHDPAEEQVWWFEAHSILPRMSGTQCHSQRLKAAVHFAVGEIVSAKGTA